MLSIRYAYISSSVCCVKDIRDSYIQGLIHVFFFSAFFKLHCPLDEIHSLFEKCIYVFFLFLFSSSS